MKKYSFDKSILLALAVQAGRDRDSISELYKHIGFISVADPDFAGRRQGSSGSEFIRVSYQKGKLPIAFSLPDGSPKGANVFRLDCNILTADFQPEVGDLLKKGHLSFKATALVDEDGMDEPVRRRSFASVAQEPATVTEPATVEEPKVATVKGRGKRK
jgi:hypothetical protein